MQYITTIAGQYQLAVSLVTGTPGTRGYKLTPLQGIETYLQGTELVQSSSSSPFEGAATLIMASEPTDTYFVDTVVSFRPACNSANIGNPLCRWPPTASARMIPLSCALPIHAMSRGDIIALTPSQILSFLPQRISAPQPRFILHRSRLRPYLSSRTDSRCTRQLLPGPAEQRGLPRQRRDPRGYVAVQAAGAGGGPLLQRRHGLLRLRPAHDSRRLHPQGAHLRPDGLRSGKGHCDKGDGVLQRHLHATLDAVRP